MFHIIFDQATKHYQLMFNNDLIKVLNGIYYDLALIEAKQLVMLMTFY